MDVVVFGATGRAGSAVVERALGRGHRVTAFVRSREKLGDLGERVEVVVGDARDAVAVRDALRGSEAAIVALGSRMRDGAELSDAAAVLIDAAQEVGLRRLITISQVGVFLTRTAPEFAPVRLEHLRVLELLRGSGLAWTAIAPPAIEDRSGTGGYAVALDERAPRWSISRFDLADALLDAIARPEWIGHVVGVSEPVREDPLT